MRTLIAALVCFPIAAAAQTPPQPLIVTGATARAIGAGQVNVQPSPPPDPRATRPKASAQETLSKLGNVCNLVEKDGTLYAACDNTEPSAKIPGVDYLPQTSVEWEAFVKTLAEADQAVNLRKRPVVVLNVGKVVVQASAGGVVTLK